MRTVYLDNFRGFQNDTTVLTPVTFLVGENSSGKTSFLSAVELLSSFEFWSEPTFNSETANLGSFNDIVSINASRRTSFTMGWSDIDLDDSKQRPMFALLSFRRRNAKPQLFRYSFLHVDTVVMVQYNRRSIKVKTEKIPAGDNFNRLVMGRFERLAKTHSRALAGAEEIDGDPSRFPFRSPFFGPMEYVPGYRDERKVRKQRSPVLIPGLDLASIAPIRTKPSAIYDAVEADRDSLGSHTPYLIRRELSKRGKGNKLRAALRSFGQTSGLFRDVKVHSFGKQNESPSGSGSPFEIGVVLEEYPINLPFVGYGVSQILPIVVDAVTGDPDQSFLIQQPEVHLHPRAQAALGDLIFELASVEDKWFFIETHSDYMVDRFRLAMSKTTKRSERPMSSVSFFERSGGFNRSHFVLIEPNGRYSEQQPSGFREFFLKESLELLDI